METDGPRERASEPDADEEGSEARARPTDRPEFFERVVQHTTDAVVSFDRDGEVVFANDASARQFGYDPAALRGRSVLDLFPERLRDWIADALDDADTDRRFAGWDGAEFLIRRADGTETPASITLTDHVEAGRTIHTAIVRDITARVERREELERRLAAATDDTDALDADRDPDADHEAGGDRVDDVDADGASLADIAAEAWATVAADDDATLQVDDVATVDAAPATLRDVLTDCFRALDRAGTVHVGSLDDDDDADDTDADDDAAAGVYVAAAGLVPATTGGSPVDAAVRTAAAADWTVAVDADADGVRLVVRPA